MSTSIGVVRSPPTQRMRDADNYVEGGDGEWWTTRGERDVDEGGKGKCEAPELSLGIFSAALDRARLSRQRPSPEPFFFRILGIFVPVDLRKVN